MWRAFASFRKPLTALVLLPTSLMLGIASRAFEYPLSPQSVRQAYFFGRSSDRGKVAEFLGRYIRVFQAQDDNSFVARIELRTPYQRVVQKSWENQSDYSAQEAQIDYSTEADRLTFRVLLHVGAARPNPSDVYLDSKGRVLDHRENFWRDFQFRVAQDHVIQPRRVMGHPLYGRRGQGLAGAEVDLEFDASEFTPNEVRIEIVSPHDRTTKTSFALEHLK